MKLSTKGRYGLRAMIDLASHEEEGAVSIASISERQNISESYLEQLVRPLRKAGFIESVRGAGGGYVLAKPADSISGRRCSPRAGRRTRGSHMLSQRRPGRLRCGRFLRHTLCVAEDQ